YVTFIPPIVTELSRLYLRELERRYGHLQSDQMERGSELLRDDQPIFHTENRRLPLAIRLMTHISDRELENIVKIAARRAGLEHWRHVYPHCLRKTFEIFLRNQPEDARLDIKECEYLFGHKLPGVQEEYFPKMIEELREKYARLNFELGVRIKKEERLVSEAELPAFFAARMEFCGSLAKW
ncbi:MAG: hypothetical protein RMJ15_08535, partial [Nitrososphaerota archaeon]|nr:hypothetical protein [Candidatus Bathyarchaeota archaeon]MDW8023764.1 hypothetical protein [Nitrososphaerota archaeon]